MAAVREDRRHFYSGKRAVMIMELDEEWRKYPVLHFDLSSAKLTTAQEVKLRKK